MASALAAPAASAAAPAATTATPSSSTLQHQRPHHHHAPTVPSTSSVLRRVIPWDTYVAAKLLEPGTDAASLRAADKLFSTRRAVAAAAENGAPSSAAPPAPPSSHDAAPVSPEELSATAALLSVLRGVTKEETVQYVLAVLDAEVAGSPRRARELFDRRESGTSEGAPSAPAPSSSLPPDAADLFLLALSRPDWFSVERAASLLAARFGAGGASGDASPASSSSPDVERQRGLFLDWILAQLQRPAHTARGVPAAAGALAKLLRAREARSAAAAAGAPRLLVPLVQRLTGSSSAAPSASSATAAAAAACAPSVPATPQLAYDLCISLWQLALTPQGAEAAVSAGAVPALTDVLRAAVAAKEKVVRAAAQALRALLSPAGGGAEAPSASPAPSASAPPSASTPTSSTSASALATAAGAAAVSCGLARACDSLLAQQWDDPDVPGALRACREASAAAARRAASWPAYRAEVLGGRLAWGPAHDGSGGGGGGSDDPSGGLGFWQRNAARLEERDAEVLRSLVRLLAAPSSDAETLAVACSDLARYADASADPERARGQLSSLGANAHATRLLAHADPEVRRHALAAVQRIVLSRDKLHYLNF